MNSASTGLRWGAVGVTTTVLGLGLLALPSYLPQGPEKRPTPIFDDAASAGAMVTDPQKPEGGRPGSPKSLPSLVAQLEHARLDRTTSGARERAWVLHEIGRQKTAEGRAYLIHLAQSDSEELIERLAAVSALGKIGDRDGLNEIAAATSNSYVQAKIDLMWTRQRTP